MKKRVEILAMLAFFNMNTLPMLVGSSSPAPELASSSKTTDDNTTPQTISLTCTSSANQLKPVQPAKNRRCCSSFLSEILTHLGNLQPQTSFGVTHYHYENDSN